MDARELFEAWDAMQERAERAQERYERVFHTDGTRYTHMSIQRAYKRDYHPCNIRTIQLDAIPF